MKKLIKLTVAVCITLSVITINVSAEEFNAFINTDSKCKMGENFTVTLKYKSEHPIFYFWGRVDFDESAFRFVSGGNKVDSHINTVVEPNGITEYEYSLVFEPIKEGCANFFFTANASNGILEYTKSDNKTVNITADTAKISKSNNNKNNKANDNQLVYSIMLGKNAIPDFNSNSYNYKVDVDFSTEKIDISAVTKEGATVSGAGRKKLKVGENIFKLTAKSGSNKKTYTLNIYRKSVDETEKTTGKNVVSSDKKRNLSFSEKFNNMSTSGKIVLLALIFTVSAILITVTYSIFKAVKLRKKKKFILKGYFPEDLDDTDII